MIDCYYLCMSFYNFCWNYCSNLECCERGYILTIRSLCFEAQICCWWGLCCRELTVHFICISAIWFSCAAIIMPTQYITFSRPESSFFQGWTLSYKILWENFVCCSKNVVYVICNCFNMSWMGCCALRPASIPVGSICGSWSWLGYEMVMTRARWSPFEWALGWLCPLSAWSGAPSPG